MPLLEAKAKKLITKHISEENLPRTDSMCLITPLMYDQKKLYIRMMHILQGNEQIQ